MKSRLSVLKAAAVLIAIAVVGCSNQDQRGATESAVYAAAAQRDDYRAPACYPAQDMCLNGGDCCSGQCEYEKCL